MEPAQAPQGQPPPAPANPQGKRSFMDKQFGNMSGCGQWFIIILFPFIGLILGLIGLLACKDVKARSRAGTMALVGGIWFAIALLIMFGKLNSLPGVNTQKESPKIDMRTFFEHIQFQLRIGNADVAERVLHDVGVNRKGEGDDTLLGIAAFNRDTNVVLFLVSKGADVNAKDDDGFTPLMQAMLMGNDNKPAAPIVEILVANGADPNAQDKQGNTPLILASERGVLEAAQALVAKGADINAKNNQGWTALKCTSYQAGRSGGFHGENEVVDFLKEQGAKE